MTAHLLYPRLPAGSALERLQELSRLPLDALRTQGELDHPAAEFNPVGGRRVSRGRLAELRDDLREVATELGFPEPLGPRTADADERWRKVLYERMSIVPADAGHEGVWSFISLVLVPELPPWRFPSRNEERWRGLPRNTFRRLWWRAHVVGELGDHLTEDQLVQIMERPTLGGSPRVAQALVGALLATQKAHPEIPREALMREAAKRMIRLTPFLSVYCLRDEQLEELTGEVFGRAADAIAAREGYAPSGAESGGT